MKKILLSFALSSLLVSCSQNEVSELGSSLCEINFSTLNEKVTKSPNSTNSSYQVYAKLDQPGATNWYINDVLTPLNITASSNSMDNPTKIHYWPNLSQSWTMKFYAYAPNIFGNKSTAVTADFNTESISVAYSVPAKAQEDFSVASPVTIVKPAVGYPSNVHFIFKHMLTKINITSGLSKELTDAGYTMSVTGTSLNMLNSIGTLNISNSNPEWTGLSTPAVYSNAGANYMVLPQNTVGSELLLKEVVIKKDGVVVFNGDVKYKVKEADILNSSESNDDNKFLMGKSYNMNVTISGTSHDGNGENEGNPIFGPKIIFSSEYVTWEVVNNDLAQK